MAAPEPDRSRTSSAGVPLEVFEERRKLADLFYLFIESCLVSIGMAAARNGCFLSTCASHHLRFRMAAHRARPCATGDSA